MTTLEYFEIDVFATGAFTGNPLAVVCGADNLSDEHAIPAALRAMGPLMEFPGAFVFGSNDYFYPKLKNPLRYFDDSHAKGAAMRTGEFDIAQLRDGFTAGGWLDLTHRRERVQVGADGGALELVGVDDPHLEYDDYAQVAGEAASRRGEVAATIGVVHAPYTRVLDAMRPTARTPSSPVTRTAGSFACRSTARS